MILISLLMRHCLLPLMMPSFRPSMPPCYADDAAATTDFAYATLIRASIFRRFSFSLAYAASATLITPLRFFTFTPPSPPCFAKFHASFSPFADFSADAMTTYFSSHRFLFTPCLRRFSPHMSRCRVGQIQIFDTLRLRCCRQWLRFACAMLRCAVSKHVITLIADTLRRRVLGPCQLRRSSDDAGATLSLSRGLRWGRQRYQHANTRFV